MGNLEKIVYADYAATTPLSSVALDAMMPYLTEQYGNPSSIYSIARTARRALESARKKVAASIGAQPEEIYFTSGGSESDNWAIKGAAEKFSGKGKHIISTRVEHHAVLHTLGELEKKGYELTYLDVDALGRIDPAAVKKAIRPDTILITVMMANNEIGTIEPVKEIGLIAKEAGVIFHTDAVQAVGHIPIDLSALPVDMLSLSGHKFRGPKGVGALYIRKGLRLSPLIQGGAQERNARAGTENVAGIMGMAAALEDAAAQMEQNAKKVRTLRDQLIEHILTIPYTRLTGDPENRLPGSASFVIEYIEGESLVLSLDAEGICASSGSACSSGSLDPSHVLLSIGLPHEVAHGSLRLSIGEETTQDEISYILEKLPPIVDRLRSMSPLWEQVSVKAK